MGWIVGEVVITISHQLNCHHQQLIESFTLELRDMLGSFGNERIACPMLVIIEVPFSSPLHYT